MNGTLGLDFGTSTTFLALTDRVGRTSVIPLGSAVGSADAFLPSVAYPNGRGFEVGEQADNRAGGVVRSVKRCITRKTQSVQTSGTDPRDVPADEVIAVILRETIRRAEQLQPTIFAERTVRLGCPAMWDGSQRRRLADIASNLGLDVTVQEIVDEPIAAGVGWVTDQRTAGKHVEGRLLVVDIGGGTLDVAVLDVWDDGIQPSFTVLSADAQDQAGDDVDAAIARDLRDTLVAQGKDPGSCADAALTDALLLQAARTLKIRLSSSIEASVGVDPVLGVSTLAYSRAALEQQLQPMLLQAEGLVRSVLASGRMRERHAPGVREISRELATVTNDVQHVLLTGGTSQIPAVHDFFTRMFPKAMVVKARANKSQHAVATGLAATETYGRLNLHRPPFDLVARYPGGAEQTLYAAYTPLYERYQIQNGHGRLGHASSLMNESRADQDVEIFCRDLGGDQVPMVTVGAEQTEQHSESLTLRLPGGRSGVVKLYVDGQLLLSAGDHEASYRMESWPVLRSDQRGVPSTVRLIKEDRYAKQKSTTGETPGEPG